VIELIRGRAAAGPSRAVRLGIGDDCAILAPPPGHELLVTTDFSLEGRHFRRDWHPAAAAGHRTLARGLSDLAAMGAEPLAAFLSLALPREQLRRAAGRRWLAGFLDGLLALAAQHRVPLAGGDTSESPSAHILADIVLLGSAPAGRALRRSGARAGDLLYVTGALGGAAAELQAIELQALAQKPRRGSKRADAHPHLYPQPRLAVGRALLQRRLATACIDLSDGLSTDLAHLLDASSAAAGHPLAAEVMAAALPLHPLARAPGTWPALGAEPGLQMALHGGEDYELLFTARPGTRIPRRLAGVPITPIGRILIPSTLSHSKPSRLTSRTASPSPRRSPAAAHVTPQVALQVTLVDEHNRRLPLPPGGWEHLA